MVPSAGFRAAVVMAEAFRAQAAERAGVSRAMPARAYPCHSRRPVGERRHGQIPDWFPAQAQGGTADVHPSMLYGRSEDRLSPHRPSRCAVRSCAVVETRA